MCHRAGQFDLNESSLESTASLWLLIALAAFAANLPFFSQRIFFTIRPQSGKKGMHWRLLEWLVFYGLIGGLAALLESRAHGSLYPQRWEFYAITQCLFLVFAFPGFVYRYLWRKA